MSDVNLYDILRRPIITEKAVALARKYNQYTFEVAPYATKPLIREAVEKLFDVKVKKVTVMNVPAKRRRDWRTNRWVIRRKGYKKAIVTLEEGYTLPIYEGVQE